MKAKIFNTAGNLVINVDAHPSTWRKVWREVQAHGLTMSPAKYCEARRAFGVYQVCGPRDAVQCLWDLVFSDFAG